MVRQAPVICVMAPPIPWSMAMAAFLTGVYEVSMTVMPIAQCNMDMSSEDATLQYALCHHMI